jgi:hypothetical protein
VNSAAPAHTSDELDYRLARALAAILIADLRAEAAAETSSTSRAEAPPVAKATREP